MSYKGLIECLREGIEYDPSFSEVQHANETMDKAADKIIKQAVQIVKLQARNETLEDALRRCFKGETQAVRNERILDAIEKYTSKDIDNHDQQS